MCMSVQPDPLTNGNFLLQPPQSISMAKDRPDDLPQDSSLYAAAPAFSPKLAPSPDLAPAVGSPDVASLSGCAAWLQLQCQEHLTALANASPASVYTSKPAESHQAAAPVYPFKATEACQAAPPQYNPQLPMLTPTDGHSPYLRGGDRSSVFTQQWLEGVSAVPSSQAPRSSGLHGQSSPDGFAMAANVSRDHTATSHMAMLTQQALLNAARGGLSSGIQKCFEPGSPTCMEPYHFGGELQHCACVLLLYVHFVGSSTMLAASLVGLLHCCVPWCGSIGLL